ncbi:hypothetical protein Tco_1339522, partial [Tanacetum coccineum]
MVTAKTLHLLQGFWKNWARINGWLPPDGLFACSKLLVRAQGICDMQIKDVVRFSCDSTISIGAFYPSIYEPSESLLFDLVYGKDEWHSDFVNGKVEFLVVLLRNIQYDIWLGNLIVQALIGVSDNKPAMSSATRRLQWSSKNTINAEMQQHDCKVNIMLQQ